MSSDTRQISARNIQLHPRTTRKQFEKNRKQRTERYDLELPALTVSQVDLRALLQDQLLRAAEARATGIRCQVYLDRSLPFRTVKWNNFPHQILMRAPVPFCVSHLVLNEGALFYTEYNPGMGQTGTIRLEKLHGEVGNLTNMPSVIREHPQLSIRSAGLFMGKVPLSSSFRFNLARHRTGDFEMNLGIGTLDSAILNPVTVPLAEFMIKKGTIQKGVAHIQGNNRMARGTGTLLYRDLYLIGLKKGNGGAGTVRKKALLSFLGHLFLVKNNNPRNGQAARQAHVSFQRTPVTTFFSLVWRTIFLGILQIIGLPASFADRKY